MRIDGCFKKSFIICIPSEQQQSLQCRTKQALRPGAQAKAIWPEIGAAAVLSWRESLCQNQSHVLPSVYLRGLETESPACGQQSGVFAFEGRGFIPFYRAALVGKAGWVPQAQAYGPRAARLRSRPTSDDRAESPPNRGPGESSHRGRVSGGNGALGFSFPS